MRDTEWDMLGEIRGTKRDEEGSIGRQKYKEEHAGRGESYEEGSKLN